MKVVRSLCVFRAPLQSKYFEKTKHRKRFQKIIIEEPDTESAISILRGIKEKYETHHKVFKRRRYRCSRIITTLYYQSFSLDKAIDLMDEAASKYMKSIKPRRTRCFGSKS
jgi:ATP-dependent Clp protease ATP-binding subunit ClpB